MPSDTHDPKIAADLRQVGIVTSLGYFLCLDCASWADSIVYGSELGKQYATAYGRHTEVCDKCRKAVNY